MAEQKLGARETVEQTAEHQTQGVRTCLETPFPCRAPQALRAVERGRGHHGIGWMQIDRGSQRLRALPERGERRMVEILSVRVAVDHRAAELQFTHAALEFVRRRLGVL